MYTIQVVTWGGPFGPKVKLHFLKIDTDRSFQRKPTFPFSNRDPIRVQKSTEILPKQRSWNSALRVSIDFEKLSVRGGEEQTDVNHPDGVFTSFKSMFLLSGPNTYFGLCRILAWDFSSYPLDMSTVLAIYNPQTSTAPT